MKHTCQYLFGQRSDNTVDDGAIGVKLLWNCATIDCYYAPLKITAGEGI